MKNESPQSKHHFSDNGRVKAIAIGGSAGSFKVIVEILNNMTAGFNIPVFLCLHRLKHVRCGFVEALSLKSNLKISEPLDKDFVKNEMVYLAPANYHMYVAPDKQIHLSTEDTTNHSRPSVDNMFFSLAETYKSGLIGILLSGANRDGAKGIETIQKFGGTTIIQHPDDAQVNTMPLSALDLIKPDYLMSSDEILEFLMQLSKK
ncbi:MAG: hypothetical protein A2W91_07485 [Bacteroidetes bacterium GWF2_38_335]|nr:MAG: hypothetical protein A2W91_07485 [Bacteroidetes bacterium GWF2_38_335]OFY78566.1 MAG: hypothetical protein A2281_17775 [Bacteroidetes bacterium RIFOXYA12_FULL_38_20]HBS85062.1 chemotaxis protein CheB [Bacteroidales bacterium]